MTFSNHWITADGTFNDSPILIHYRGELDDIQASDSYQQCVQIAWTAEDVNPINGYPSQDELAKIDDFNARLMSVIETDAHGVVVMVLTSQGVNQWIIYCRDLEEVRKDLDRIPTDQGLYPIEVVAEQDAQWETFTQLRDAIKAH